MKKSNPFRNVDVLDLVRIDVFTTTPGNFEVLVNCLDNTKNVVFDESALKELNQQITTRAKEMSAYDPRTKDYIKEFTGRMLSEMYRNGLVELEDAKEAPDDPYEKVRKMGLPR